MSDVKDHRENEAQNLEQHQQMAKQNQRRSSLGVQVHCFENSGATFFSPVNSRYKRGYSSALSLPFIPHNAPQMASGRHLSPAVGFFAFSGPRAANFFIFPSPLRKTPSLSANAVKFSTAKLKSPSAKSVPRQQ